MEHAKGTTNVTFAVVVSAEVSEKTCKDIIIDYRTTGGTEISDSIVQ